tara:strand:+ start:3521 stop:3934 length:414 start_codon:yes stop_codon:yes gene_type:complete
VPPRRAPSFSLRWRDARLVRREPQRRTTPLRVRLRDSAANDSIARGSTADNRIARGSIARGSIAHDRIAHGRIAHDRIAHGRIAHGRIAHDSTDHDSITLTLTRDDTTHWNTDLTPVLARRHTSRRRAASLLRADGS